MGACFPTPDLIARRGVKYAKVQLSLTVLKAMIELGACVSLLGKCHPLGYDRMRQEKTKVARFAKVTGRSDRKTFSLATTYHFNLPACF